MLNHRIRILASLIVAFIVVNLYGRLSTGPVISPIQADNIKNLLSNLKFNPASLTKLFTLKFNSDDNNLTTKRFNNGNNSFVLPSISTVPTEAPEEIIENEITPTKSDRLPTPTTPKKINPTLTPKPPPTKTPKPTKPPKPTATPVPAPITSDTRPGTSLAEIFQEVGKRTCFPPALLRAFQTKESGPFFNYSNSASIIKIYNTYGWWITGAGNPCFGLGYHTQTGIVPQDSVKAGVRCRNAVGSPTDIKIMGIMQISEWEEQTSRKSTLSSLPKNIDRRVLFDNALIFAYITRARVGNPPKDCNNWPDAMIKTAAEKHLGTCKYNYGNGNTGDYCADILKYYKQYK